MSWCEAEGAGGEFVRQREVEVLRRGSSAC